MEKIGRGYKNNDLRETILFLLAEGYRQSDIARYCDVSRQRVNSIIKDMDKEASHEAD